MVRLGSKKRRHFGFPKLTLLREFRIGLELRFLRCRAILRLRDEFLGLVEKLLLVFPIFLLLRVFHLGLGALGLQRGDLLFFGLLQGREVGQRFIFDVLDEPQFFVGIPLRLLGCGHTAT